MNEFPKRRENQSTSTKGILKPDIQKVNAYPKRNTGSNQQITESHSFSQPLPIRPTNPDVKQVTSDSQQKNNRRVSFAPDVTLHSFDAIPQPTPYLTRSTNDTTNDNTGMDFTEPFHSSTQRADNDEENEAMDITGVYSTGKNDTAQERTGERKENDNDADMSMDLTSRQEQLTPILLPVDTIHDRQIPSGTKRITRTPNNNSQYQNDNPEEEPMELTEVMSVPQTKLQEMSVGNPDSTASEENSLQVSQPMDLTQIQKTDHHTNDDTSAMDLTEAPVINQETEDIASATETTKPHAATYSSADDSVAMDLTGFQKSPIKGNTYRQIAGLKQSQDAEHVTDDTSMTMDITQQGDNPPRNKEHSKSTVSDTANQNSHELKQTLRPDESKQTKLATKPRPESKIPPPSNIPRIVRKRQKLGEPIKPIEQFIDHTPPPAKKAKFSSTTGDLSDMERMSPIRIEEYNSFNKTANEVTIEPNPQTNLSLKSFIKETDVGFLTDINILKNDPKTISFTSVADSEAFHVKIQNLYDALYNDVPIIQMNAFIIKELKSINEQSSKSFEDLDRQIQESSNHPLLLLDYYNSDPRTKQKMMEQLQLVKYYSKLNARKSFGQWYLSQLQNLKEVLEENKSFLQDEYKTVKLTLERVRQTHQRVANIKLLLTKELKILKTSPIGETTDNDNVTRKIRLAWLKKELQSHKISTDNLLELKTRQQELTDSLTIREAQLQKLKSEVIQATSSNNEMQEGELSSKYMTDTLLITEHIAGVTITSFSKSKISVLFQGKQEFHVELDFSRGANKLINLISSVSNLNILQYLLSHIEKEFMVVASTNEMHTASSLIKRLRDLLPVLREFAILDALFPTDISENGDIRFYDSNPTSNEEVMFTIPLTVFVSNAGNRNNKIVPLTATITRGNNISSDDVSAHLHSKIQKLLPWLMNNQIHIQPK